ncbi:VacJ family lipoprotein [Microbulbifer sp. 2205BS26-8]|uniref:MlaA family lipoprotein n=1 Tax=Microbulbifer sp. 2205BS26-8 TaxID=3064386 RepID=UPI00273EB764|nr:VacJ family lipoprotein [Microbulbifer sp. 2205BS26-8]MDP5209231.1 VacJ family lipoprotein [Microbulbifer sp. 2205BS26-8]
MLGRTAFSPGLIAAILSIFPVAALAQNDPFGAVSADTAIETGISGQPDSTGQTNNAGDNSGSLEEEYGFDPADEYGDADGADFSLRDPWEGFNRAIFVFNDGADRYVLKPAAVSYRQITPIFMQHGISNFFSNLREVSNTFNSLLQGKLGQAGNDAGRFLINSTVGIVGILDVAQYMGLEEGDGEDFGQTLAVWGVPSGPYLVLPLLGPSTVRDTPARVVDYYTNPITYVDHDPTRYTLRATDIIQDRASLLEAESLLQGDRYVLLRDAYLQRRDFLIVDGEVDVDSEVEAAEAIDEAEVEESSDY